MTDRDNTDTPRDDADAAPSTCRECGRDDGSHKMDCTATRTQWLRVGDDEVECPISDDNLLAVYLSGVMTGVGTACINFGEAPQDEADAIAHRVAGLMRNDPAVRETVLPSLRELATGTHETEPGGQSLWVRAVDC